MLARLFSATAMLLIAALPARAQTVDVSVLIDDRSLAGCDVTPLGLPTISGIDARLTATVDRLAAQVINVDLSLCAGASFGPPSSLGGGWPVGNDNGLGGADVVEMSVPRAMVTSSDMTLGIGAVADNGAGVDSTTLGSFAGPPTAVPGLGLAGLLVLILLVLVLARLALKRQRVLLSLLLLGLAFAVLALHFNVDGNIDDWGGAPLVTDPLGDGTNGESAVDIVGVFTGQENQGSGPELFFRVDMADAIINNLPPVAQDDNLATDEDNPVAGDLFADNGNGIDSDPDADPFTVTMVAGTATVGAAVSLPSGAQVTVNADGTFSYDPLTAFNFLSQGQITTDTFTYTIDDGIGGPDQGAATVTISGINDLGTALDDPYNTGEDTPLNPAAPGVLLNDTDPDTNDTLTAVLDAAPANALSFTLNGDGSFNYTPALNFNGADPFSYHFNDGTADSNIATATITVGAVNDPPVANDDMGDATDEDTLITTQNVLTNDTDIDMDMLSVASVDAVSAMGAAITNNGNGTFDYGPATSATLDALSVGQMVTDTFSYTATDGLLNDTAMVSIDVTGVNDPMTANDDSGAGFATDEDTLLTTGNVLSNDTDPDALDTLSVMSADAASAQGATITDNLDGTFDYDPTGATALQALATGQMLTDTFSYTGTDSNGSMDTATVSIEVTGINDAPVIAFPTPGAIFNNIAPINLDPAATLTDPDSPNFDTGDLTVSVALSADPAMCDVSDVLTVENQGMGATQIGFDGTNVSYGGTVFGTVTANYLCTDTGGGTFTIDPLLISFDANASVAAVTALLQALQYSTTSSDDQDRQASAMVTDGDGGTSNAALQTITVNLNQAPVITSDGGGATASVNAAENQTAVTTVTATDADIPAQTLTFSITGGADQTLFSIGAMSGVLAFNSAPDFDAPADAGADNVYDVQVTVTDDGTPILSDVQDIAVTVTDVNEAPVITSDGGGATAAVNAAENQTAVTTVTATDEDLPAQTLAFSITGGADQALFSIGAGSGVLTFNAPPDFDAPADAGGNNVYDVQVTVTDNGAPNLTDVQDIAVTVTDVNESPVITSDGGGATAAVNAAENQTAVTTVTATDADIPAQTLTFTITGGADQASFSIVAGSGVLTFSSAPNFENPTDAGMNNVYDVQVTVTDNGAPNLSDVQDIAVTVIDVNDAPVITSDGGGATAAVNAAENQTAVTTVTATDEDLPAQTLTFSITGGADQALFSIGAGSGVLTFNSAPDFENPTDAGANNVYDVQVTVTDNGAPNLTDVQDIAVTVTDVNDAPVITSDGGGATAAVNAAENQTAVTTVTATDEDLPAQTLSFTITGGADQALFGITAGGVLTFNSPPNFENPTDAGMNNVYDVQVTVTDNGAPNLSDVQDIAVTVTDVNDAPVITSDGAGATAAVNAAENQTAATTVTAADNDVPAQTLNFSITGGADQALFGIVAGTGVLTFNAAPDFENPGDTGMNNVYDVQVTVTDNGAPNLSDVQDIAVTVTNVNEAPTGVNDNFTNVIINTLFEAVDTAGAGPFDPPRRQVSGNLLGNDTDPDAADAGNLVVQAVSDVATTHASGTGRITINADGTFTYLPPLDIAGDASTATFEDSFTYTVEDTATNTDTATINFSILMAPVVWYIDNSQGAGDGRSSTPFNSIGAFNGSSGPSAGDTVFIHSQNGGNAAYATGINLQNTQSLLGEGVDLVIDSTTLVGGGAGQHPTLTTTNATGINLASGNTVRGLNIGNTGSGTGIVGNAFGTLTIDDVGISGTGGILNLTNGTVTDPTAGDFTFSSLASTSNPGIGIDLNTVGGGFTVDTTTSISGGTLGIDIDNSPAGASFDFGATTVTGGTDAGIDIATSGTATFTFDSLSTTNDSGAGLRASTGGTVNIAGAGNTIASTGGPGIDLTSTSLGAGATFSSVSSFSSTGDGINLDSVTGFLTINGGSITTSSGIAFDVNAGSSNVTYAGSITNTSNRSVEVTNRMGGTVQFGGFIDDDGTGIFLDSNGTGTVNFRGGMALDTGANTAFAATGGGTVEVCATANCAGGIAVVNTIGATTPLSGTAVNIADTTIGGSHVTFRSVAVDGAGASVVPAIILTNTGAGQFHVTGTGAAGSGGTVENILFDAVRFSNTDGRVTFEDMIIEDIGVMTGALNTVSGHDAIHGENVDGGLTLDNVTIRRISDNAVHGEPLAMAGFTNFGGLEILNSSLIEDTNRYHNPGACSPCGDDNNEAMVRIRGINGTVNVTDSTLRRGAELLDLSSSSAMGDSLAMTVQNSNFNDSWKGISMALGDKGLACINVKMRGAADAVIHIGDPLEAMAALGNTFTGCATIAVGIKHDDAAATGDIDVIISRNDLDNNAVELPPICCGTFGGPFGLGNWPQNSILLRARGTSASTMDSIISQNLMTVPGLAEGNEGSITVFHDGQTIPAVTAGTLQARVSENTATRPFVAGAFVIADKNTAARVLVEDNEIVGGSAMHPDFGATPVPGNSSKARAVDDGVLNVTVDTHGHGTSVVSNSPGFPEQDVVFTEPLSASFKVQGIGNPSTLCASFSNNTSERGYELREDTGSAVSVFRGVSGLTSCTSAAPVNCETVLNGLGNTGGPTGGVSGSGNPALSPPDVNVSGTSGTIALTATACPLPTGAITGGSF